jgi:hypothetical protein
VAELARTLDRQALDDDPGPRVRLQLAVPLEWAREGATVRVVAPPRVACARCDGGGCDSCGRAGAYKLSQSPDERAFELTLPAGLPADGAELRVSRPFGAGSPIAQALCQVRQVGLGELPRGCTRVDAAPGGPRGGAVGLAALSPWRVAVAVVALALAAWVAARHGWLR